jgi:hypothetical protein
VRLSITFKERLNGHAESVSTLIVTGLRPVPRGNLPHAGKKVGNLDVVIWTKDSPEVHDIPKQLKFSSYNRR